MRSNAHTYQQLKVLYQTYNAQALTLTQRFVIYGVHQTQKILSALHWLSAAPLQSLKSVLARQTSLGQLLGVEIQLAQAAPGVLQLRLAGIKLQTLALLCRLHVPRQLKLSPYLARLGM
jgi:hypothetical protein